jgi:hypothetical protein
MNCDHIAPEKSIKVKIDGMNNLIFAYVGSWWHVRMSYKLTNGNNFLSNQTVHQPAVLVSHNKSTQAINH